MNTRTIALTIVLTAVAVVLNPGISGIVIPSFVPTLSFQLWEIAIFTAFFLLGMKIACGISFLNTVIRLVVSPGVSFNQPIIHLMAVLSTLIGVYLGYKLLSRKKSRKAVVLRRRLVLSTTVLGIIFRLAIMMPFIYVVALFVGNSLVLGLVPLIAVHDLIAAFYSIPLGYLVADIVNRSVYIDEKI